MGRSTKNVAIHSMHAVPSFPSRLVGALGRVKMPCTSYVAHGSPFLQGVGALSPNCFGLRPLARFQCRRSSHRFSIFARKHSDAIASNHSDAIARKLSDAIATRPSGAITRKPADSIPRCKIMMRGSADGPTNQTGGVGVHRTVCDMWCLQLALMFCGIIPTDPPCTERIDWQSVAQASPNPTLSMRC